MSQYIIKFSKEGAICYISHLDLLRLFKRAFKKAGIRLSYSKGFNPHPKMGFAQPLSLGYASICEYLEFETETEYEPETLKGSMEDQMPEGIRIFSSRKEIEQKKSLAARTVSAEYQIQIPLSQQLSKGAESLFREFLAQKEISVLKKQKKSKELKPVNIREKIQELKAEIKDGELCIKALLDCGSQSNLSPELLITAIADFLKLEVNRGEIRVIRLKLNFEK